MAPNTSAAPASTPYERQFDVCSRPANPAKPTKPSTAAETLARKPRNAAGPNTDDASQIESDASSELSSSSEEPSDDSDDDEQDHDELATSADNEDPVVNLRANQGQKPVMRFDPEDMGDDIRTFLKDFLPKLKAANEELEAQKAAGTLKTAEIIDDGEQGAKEAGEDGGEQYIELNLGLGVLEAKDADAAESSDSDTDDANGEEGGQTGKEDVLRKLMGQDKTHEKAGIQVVDEPRGS